MADTEKVDLPFEMIVVDEDRGGLVSIVVTEKGTVQIRDCYGDIWLSFEDAVALTQAITEAGRRKVELMRRKLGLES